MSPTSEIKIKNIDHLGIVAGLIDEIGIVEIINSLIRNRCSGKDFSRNISKSYFNQWIRVCVKTFVSI